MCAFSRYLAIRACSNDSDMVVLVLNSSFPKLWELQHLYMQVFIISHVPPRDVIAAVPDMLSSADVARIGSQSRLDLVGAAGVA